MASNMLLISPLHIKEKQTDGLPKVLMPDLHWLNLPPFKAGRWASTQVKGGWFNALFMRKNM